MKKRNLKVNILVPSLAQKGPVIVARNLAIGLSELGVDITFFYLQEKNENLLIFPEKIKTKKLTFSTLKQLLQSDIIHSHSLLPDLISSFLFIRYNKKIQFITTIHNRLFSDLNYEYTKVKATVIKLLWLVMWKFKHRYVTLTKSAQDEYCIRIPFIKNKITYCYNGIDLSLASIPSGLDKLFINEIKEKKRKGNKIIGTCAVLTERKGIDFVINSMKFIDNNTILIIVGDGPYKNKLVDLTIKYGLTNRVLFYKSTSVPLEYMRLFDVFVMPSLSEGFGLTVIEAVSCNCNIVLSNIDTFIELFSDIDFISIVNVKDIKVFANEIERQLGISKEINCQSRCDLVKKFSYQAMSERYLSIYLNKN